MPLPPSLAELPERTKVNMRLSVLEGSLSTVMGTLVGGAFLTGFALTLGATDAHVGLLAAIPALANLVQIFGSLLIRRFGSRRLLCVLTAGASRLLWTGVLALPLVFVGDGWRDARVWLLMAGIALISVFGAISGVAWLSWICDLIPDGIRGRFFGRQNMVAQATAMVTGVAAGRFVDWWGRYQGAASASSGFSIIFGVGVAFGLSALVLLWKVEEPLIKQKTSSQRFLAELRQPLVDQNFRRQIMFTVAWSFAVGLAGPFFSVYMIKELSIPFSLIATLGVASGGAALMGVRLWGGLIDSIGPKPLLMLCSIGQATVPLWWIFARPDAIGAVWVVHIVSGFASSGVGLASSNLIIRLAPKENNASYFGVHAALVGLVGALAPLIGGTVGALLAGSNFAIGALQLQGLHVLFLASAALRFSSLLLLRSVQAGEKVDASQLLSNLQAFQQYFPVQGAHRMASLGLASFENMGVIMARGSGAMERSIEHSLRRGMQRLEHARAYGRGIEEHVDSGLDSWEAKLDYLIDRIAKYVQTSKPGDSGDKE